jgi:hypothetical protein
MIKLDAVEISTKNYDKHDGAARRINRLQLTPARAIYIHLKNLINTYSLDQVKYELDMIENLDSDINEVISDDDTNNYNF